MTILTDDFVFIHVPKTGGSSIIAAFLNPGNGSVESRQLRAANPPADLPPRWRPSFLGVHLATHQIDPSCAQRSLVASKRNPWAWYASWYEFSLRHMSLGPKAQELVKGQEWGYFSQNGKFDLNDTLKHMYDLDLRERWNAHDHKSLRAINRWRKRGEGIYTDRYRSYLRFNTDLQATRKDGSVWDATYLRCEHLMEDLYAYLSTFDKVPTEMRARIDSLPRENVSVHRDYREYYTDDTLELVRAANAPLIDYFGYIA